MAKWLLLAVCVGLGAVTYWQVTSAPFEHDLPPCHVFLVILVLGAWSVYLFVSERRRRERGK